MPEFTHTIATNPKLRREWVKYQLKASGSSMAALAAKHGINRRNIYMAFNRPWPRGEKIIADSVGLAPQALFPERYDEHGLPTRRD